MDLPEQITAQNAGIATQPQGKPKSLNSDSALKAAISKRNSIPLSLKVGFSLFMVILVPFYWQAYGPSNFLYFCDIALFLTLVGLWRESKLLISMAAVGILLPQFIWVIDFAGGFFGASLLGMTDYMFRDSISLFARGLSLFHGWLPFLLLFLVSRLDYDRRALAYWSVVAIAAMLVSYFFMPAPGDILSHPNQPININYVYGFSETVKQQWLPDAGYLFALMIVLPLAVYWPTHQFLKRWRSVSTN